MGCVRTFTLALVLCSCTKAPAPSATVLAQAEHRPIARLDGAALAPLVLPAEFVAEYESKLVAAQQELVQSPDSLDAAIWVGRRLGYLGRYRESIAHYGDMLSRFPEEPRLLRHRGHRYLTVRELDAAIADLQAAAQLVSGKPDRVEEDGLPNARNQPTSTLKTNIHYHLGLAYFLTRRFEEAEVAYRACLRFSTNPDMEVATRQWLFVVLVRQGRWADARAVAEPVTAGWDIIENDGYLRLLLMAKGEVEPDALLADPGDDQPASAAVRFGVAHFLRWVGSADALTARSRGESVAVQPNARASETLRALAADPGWAAFGVLAAEAELAD